MDKRYADINGHFWQVGYPFCAGCSELVISGFCAHKGNGCLYPEQRIKRPVNYCAAFYQVCRQYVPGKTLETISDELGDCLAEVK
jgi:hypothetical protein